MSCNKTPDLRLVLVGSQWYGAESVGSRILGGEEFEWGERTVHTVTHMGQVNGKLIQLVKAPVWLRSYTLCDTAELVKEELVLSVTHCKPGPHAFILLVEADLPFTVSCAKAAEAHLELYGKNVWSHTVVLFTCVDWLGSTNIEEYIAGEGDGLAQLLERCGGRYVIDNTEESLSQRLLDQVQTLVKKNEGKHLEIKEKVLQKIHERREEVKKRAEIRRQKRIKEKKTQENEAETSLSEITIVLLGWVFGDKTSVGSSILGIPKSDGRTEECGTQTTVIGKQQLKVTVVDTPGWWKFFSASLVPSSVKSEIMKALDQHRATTHTSTMESPQNQDSSSQAFLLMIPADTSFTNEQRKIIEDNMRPLGEAVWQNTILVFTRGHWLRDYRIEQHIESEGDALIWLVEKCGNRYIVFNNDTTEQCKSVIETQVERLLEMVKEMLSIRQSTPKEETQQTAVTEEHTEAAASEEPVDEDLKKMVEHLHRIWCWRSWEIEEVAARFDERPMEVRTCDDDSMKRLIEFKRKQLEKLLLEELCGKSLEEVMEIVLEIYFHKECGAFDIVSIICENDAFKPEWKQLFEREWSRRESRLMDYVFRRNFTKKEAFGHLSSFVNVNVQSGHKRRRVAAAVHSCSPHTPPPLPHQPGNSDTLKEKNTIERTSAWVKEQIKRVLKEINQEFI